MSQVLCYGITRYDADPGALRTGLLTASIETIIFKDLVIYGHFLTAELQDALKRLDIELISSYQELMQQLHDQHESFVPLKLGFTMASEDDVRSLMQKNYEKIMTLLSRLRSKCEWTVVDTIPVSEVDDIDFETTITVEGRGIDYLRQKVVANQKEIHLKNRALALLEHIPNEVDRQTSWDKIGALYRLRCHILLDRGIDMNQPAITQKISAKNKTVQGPFPPYHFSALTLDPPGTV